MAVPVEEASLPLYHPAKPLPFELVQHVAIFFEEKLHTQALSLLLDSLSVHHNASTPTYIPSPQHLALAATFLVHPSTTARPKTTEEEEAPNVSLRLLRLVNSLVGPFNAQFNTAFLFTHFETSRHGGRRHADDSAFSERRKPLNLDRDIDIDLAQSASVWSRAEDFWHAVGWAFNCSVLHPARWERWRVWLEFMCEILEDDWSERLRRKENEPSKTTKDGEGLEGSLIVQYINNSMAGFGRNRRILRSIFADGTTHFVNEFREVFHNEVKLSRKKTPKEKENKKREAAVDIEADEYADFYLSSDYDTSSSTGDRESKRPRRSRGATRKSAADKSKSNIDSLPNPILPTAALGDTASLALRQRLLQLLSTVSEALPNHLMELQDLYHLYVEFIRPLPLPIYQSFVSPFALPHFTPAAQTTLCELLLFRLRETAAPQSEKAYLDQAKLELCFLPYATATSSLSDNAKMSITLEALIILLADDNLLVVTDDTKRLMQTGIIRRAEKAQYETRKNQLARMSEDMEWSWLCESAERLRFLVDEVITGDSASSGS
ncbi:hypothetical protein ASPCAL06415 [Aspergillus calidoustus]|uniref:Uncharacterized protein n=1 Tax=Aspergillus calidoustus TaxID=454130 RepID=A0A0U5G0A1_ASPCI|nr:hypothetical protein ASPCAL06415 [Aspergillus calidoustus]